MATPRAAAPYNFGGRDPTPGMTAQPISRGVNPEYGGAAEAEVEEEDPKKKKKTGTFIDSVQRGAGGMVANVARTARDLGLPARGMQEYGEQLEANNPAEVRSLSDIAHHPVQFLKETAGELGPQFAGAMAGARAGAMVGAPFEGVGAIPGAVIGGVLGSLATSGAQSYGGERRKQDELGVDEKGRALGAAAVSGALDTFGPVDMLARRMVTTGMIKGVGGLKNIPLKAAGEFTTEYGQDVVEDYGASGTTYGPGAGEGYLMSGLKGGVAGAGVGAIETAAGHDKTQNLPEDDTPPPAVVDPAEPTQLVGLPTYGKQSAGDIYQGGGITAPERPVYGKQSPADIYQGGPSIYGPSTPEAVSGLPPQDVNPAPSQTREEDVIHGQAPPETLALTDQRPQPMRAYRHAIGMIESTNNYSARGPLIKTGQYAGEKAAGRYGIMPGNLPEWSRAALGYEVSLPDFLASPKLQDQIFDHRFGIILKDNGGNVEDAASVWLTGHPLATAGGRKDPLGTDAPEYVRRLRKYLGQTGERYAGGMGAGSGVQADADSPVSARDTREQILAKMSAALGENVPKTSVAGRIVDAEVKDNGKAEALIEKARATWQQDAAALELDKTLLADQKAAKGAALDRQQRAIAVAEDIVRQLRAARAAPAVEPTPPAPSEAEATLAAQRDPNPALAEAGERLAADGGLDRQVAAEQLQPQPLDEASAKAIAAARAGYLKQVSDNDIIGDKEKALLDILGPDAEPLSGAEKAQLGMASRARILRQAQALNEQGAAEPIAPEPTTAEAATTAEPEPTAAAATKPTNPREPAIRERAAGRAAGLGTSQKPAFYQGVDDFFGKFAGEPPPAGSDREKWFNMGREFADTQSTELGGEPTPKPTPEPTKAKVTRRRARPKAVSEEEAEASLERDTAPKEKPQQEKAVSNADKLRDGIRARRERLAAEQAETARVAAEKKAALRAAEAAPTPPVKKTKAKKVAPPKAEKAIKASKAKVPPKPVVEETAEEKAAKKLAAEIAVFEARTERAVKDDHLSIYQRQNLDLVAATTGNLVLAEQLLNVEQGRFNQGGRDPATGKGENLGDLLARAKEAPKVTFSKVEQDALAELEPADEATLAKHYGHAEFNDDAKRSFINDVVRGVAKGWETVSANIREIAQRVAAVILAAGLVFNSLGITDAKAAAYGPMPPPATVRALPALPEGLRGATKEVQHVYRTVAPQRVALSGEGKGFAFIDKKSGKGYFFDKDAKLYYSGNVLVGKATGDLLSTGGQGLDNMTDASRITPAGAFRVRVGKSIYGDGRSLRLPGTANADGVVAVHAVWKGDPQVNREALLKEGDPSKAKVTFGCINTSEKEFIEQVLPHADELDGGLVVIIPDTENTVDEFLKGDVKDAAHRIKVAPIPEGPPTRPTPPSGPLRAPPAPEDKSPALPPERARAAVQAGRRREAGRGRPRLAESVARGRAPEGRAALESADKRLRAELDRRGLADVKLETTSMAQLEQETGEKAEGLFGTTRDRLTRAIKVALDSKNPLAVLNHELVHALEDMGVIRPGDRAKLVSTAMANPQIAAYINEKYGDRPKVERDGEAIAELFSRWVDNPAAAAQGAQGVMARVRGWFAAIKNWALGSDFKTAEDVLRAIDSGAIGSKARTAAVGSTVPQASTGRPRIAETPQARAVRGEVNRAASALDLTARDLGSKGVMMLAGTEDVANMAAKYGITAAKTFVDLHSKNHALARKFQARLVNIRDRTRDLPAKFQGAEGLVSKFLHDSTRSGKWGFTPLQSMGFPATWAQLAEVDPALADRYYAIKQQSPKAAQIIEDVFKFNYDAREQLHQAALTAINAEFNPIIEGTDSTAAEKAEAEAAKARAIQFHSRVFDTRQALPYTPMKRTGAWAIVGKSDAYLAAIEAKDHDLIEKMRSDPKHYFVDFRETTWEADKVREYVRSKFGKDNAYVFERGKSDQNAVSGVEMLVAFKRMQAAMTVEGVGNKASAKMEQMARDFYLHTLSEESARKAEMSRENVPGETMDMMEAFFTRGNATAEYTASVQNNVEMQKSLRDMQAQVSRTSAADRTAAQRFLNELMWRYENNLSAKPNRTVDRIVKATSLWTLLTSPFYYAQNFTQAVLISQPTLAARFGYAKTMAQFGRAYGDFATMTKDIGWLDALDYDKAPADLRFKNPKPGEATNVLQRLAERGRLDSGVTVEDNAAFINGDGILPKSWNRIDKFFRMMPQRIEVQNRVVTGIAAYRSAIAQGMDEEAAFEVASELIRTTHGDYSGFGSPRVFTQLGQFGKIAGQFRKFQLIMGSHVVREFNTMIRGATLEEKIMAAKSLAFLSAHMAAVGGVVGLPGMALMGPIIAAMLNALDDDDDKDWSEWKQSLRESLGAGKEDEPNLLADFLFKGAPYALLHMDTSDRLGMGNMLALAPYTGLEEAGTDKEAWYGVMGKAMLGPSGKIVANTVGALDWGINHDDWSRMAEALGPGVVGTTAKALRLQREGLVDKGGLTLFQPEEISTYDKLLTAAGVNPRKLANQSEKVSERFKAEEYYKGKTGSLKRDFVKAKKDGDASQLQDIRQEWKDIQAARRRDGFKVQPMSELLKAPRELGKNQRRIIEGVSYRPATKGFVMRQMMTPDEDFAFD